MAKWGKARLMVLTASGLVVRQSTFGSLAVRVVDSSGAILSGQGVDCQAS